eukprot:521682_1
MDDKWACLFCNFANESNAIRCSKCTKANTRSVNINQICLCGREVIKCPHAKTQCMSCCKAKDKKEKTYYYCNAKQCTYREVQGRCFVICNACYENINSSTMDSKHSFLFCKLASLVERIKKETNQCHNNDERRRYMFWVYRILYTQCIAKLSEMMSESEYTEIQDMFNAFYGQTMDQIKQNIDSKELGLASHIFVNKKKMKRKEWIK